MNQDYQYLNLEQYYHCQATNCNNSNISANYNSCQSTYSNNDSNSILVYSESSANSIQELPVSLNFDQTSNQYSMAANSSSTPKSICLQLVNDQSYYQNGVIDSAYQTKLDFSSKSSSKSYLIEDNSMITGGSGVNDLSKPKDKKTVVNKNLPPNSLGVLEKRKRPKIIKLERMTSNSEPNLAFICEVCSMEFNSAAKCLMHCHKQHNNGISTVCPLCSKKFGNHANCLVHLRAHTQEKTFHCKLCDNSFCDSSTLKKHLRTHTGEKPYECGLCPKKFTQSGNLKRHLEVHKKYDFNRGESESQEIFGGGGSGCESIPTTVSMNSIDSPSTTSTMTYQNECQVFSNYEQFQYFETTSSIPNVTAVSTMPKDENKRIWPEESDVSFLNESLEILLNSNYQNFF